jgi:N6-L-threonylcarbamoyladenine synthase
MSHYLGIDTSAYTTSLAIVDKSKQLIWETRKVLEVPNGERGLAQSAALFQHVQNLPKLVQEIPAEIWKNISGIGVSVAPRPVAGSYMPVFTPGYGIAASVASALRVPLLQTSHQEGHIAAGMISSNFPRENEFLSVHISGGTTELLKIRKSQRGKLGIEILGGSTDLHAGQFIDRIGVRLGLPFPAGKSLEEVARNSNPEAASWLPSAVKGFDVSFSGVETAAQRLVDQKKDPADVARAVEGCVARTVAKLIQAGIEKTRLTQVLIVGGVASNQFIRSELEKRIKKKAQLFWAEPDWSRDNAIGVAILTSEYLSC